MGLFQYLCVGMMFASLPSAVIAGMIGASKGDRWGSFVAGWLFGPFGILFALLSSGDGRTATCPHCFGRVPPKARVCMHCGQEKTSRRP